MYDTLDQLIKFAQLSGQRHIHCQLGGDWYLHTPAQKGQGLVHIITQGECFLRLANGTVQSLKQGDVIFFPVIHEHHLSNQKQCLNTQDTPSASHTGAFMQVYNTQQMQFNLFCVQFSYAESAQFIYSLPDIIHLKLDYEPLTALIHLFENESQQTNVQGSYSMLNALSSILFIQLIRAYLHVYQSHLTGLFLSLQHPKLGQLIHQIIKNPEHQWHIEQMADMTYLSRATFMRLFKQIMGISPYAFILDLRLQKAAYLLKNTAHSILSIALDTGFSSDTNFAKAFKKQYQCLPHEYRM